LLDSLVERILRCVNCSFIQVSKNIHDLGHLNSLDNISAVDILLRCKLPGQLIALKPKELLLILFRRTLGKSPRSCQNPRSPML
jgi:hypothetical protein